MMAAGAIDLVAEMQSSNEARAKPPASEMISAVSPAILHCYHDDSFQRLLAIDGLIPYFSRPMAT